MEIHLQNQNSLGVVYLFREKSNSDLYTFKAKENECYLQRVLSGPHNPSFTELDPRSSIHFPIL